MLCCRKETGGYAKVIHKKKREKKELKKMDKCPRDLKQWLLRCPPEKNEMNKIAHVFLQLFLSLK